jgi:hypothetical protein
MQRLISALQLENGEAMASIGVGLTAQLGAEFWAMALRFIVELTL